MRSVRDEPFFGGQAISERSLTLRTGLAAGVPLSKGQSDSADAAGSGNRPASGHDRTSSLQGNDLRVPEAEATGADAARSPRSRGEDTTAALCSAASPGATDRGPSKSVNRRSRM